jgi:glycosyltransferase involved in cell wall biosynthesis
LLQYTMFILRSFVHLAVHSASRRYDFVHVHNMPDVLVFSALVPKALGAKIILDLHDPMPELMQTIFELPEQSLSVRLVKRLEKWSIAFADLVLTVNLACKKIYSSRSCPPQKINVVLNSPEDEVFQFQPPALPDARQVTPARPFRIIYHGSLVRRNGFDLAVAALEEAKKSIPNVRLVVCGEQSAFFDEVMKSARQRGLRGNVDYMGVKDRRGIVETINGCDVGVIPNHRNIFTEINTPTRIFEYLALGKPVIAPGTRGIRDYFTDEELIFFNVGDADDLARKIEFVFSNPNKVQQTVERGQRVYLAHRWSQEKSNFLDPISAII